MSKYFLRLSNGAIYRCPDPQNVRRKDAVVITGIEAARLWRAQGVENDVTAKYPETDDEAAQVPTAHKQKRGQTKAAPINTAEAVTAIPVVDKPEDSADVAIGKMLEGLGDGSDVSTGD